MYKELVKGEKYAKGTELTDDLSQVTDAAYIIEQDEIVIDIDDPIFVPVVLALDLPTEHVMTDRGVHIYFKNTGKKILNHTCLIGCTIEIKTKECVVKRNGKVRQVLKPKQRMEVPIIFRKKAPAFTPLKEGEGRNNTLFEIAKRLPTDYREKVVRALNSLNEPPLTDAEVSNIISYEFADVAAEREVADRLVENYSLTEYQGIVWANIDNKFTREYRRQFVRGPLSQYGYNDLERILKLVDISAPSFEGDVGIKINNGIIQNSKFYETKANLFTPYCLYRNYTQDEPVEFKAFCKLTGISYEFMIDLICYCLIVDPKIIKKIAKFVIFIGDGGTGKSLLLELLGAIFEGTTSHLKLHQLAEWQYSTNLAGKLVNLGDDLRDVAINNEAMDFLKNVVTGDMCTIRALYKQGVSTRLTAKLIFSSNFMLKSFEKGHSFMRRLVIIPMENKISITAKTVQALYAEKSLDAIFSSAVNRLPSIIEGLRIPANATKRLEEYQEFNNNSLEYIESLTEPELKGQTMRYVYEGYERYCHEMLLEPVTKRQFVRSLNQNGWWTKQLMVAGERTYVLHKSEEAEA